MWSSVIWEQVFTACELTRCGKKKKSGAAASLLCSSKHSCICFACVNVMFSVNQINAKKKFLPHITVLLPLLWKDRPAQLPILLLSVQSKTQCMERSGPPLRVSCLWEAFRSLVWRAKQTTWCPGTAPNLTVKPPPTCGTYVHAVCEGWNGCLPPTATAIAHFGSPQSTALCGLSRRLAPWWLHHRWSTSF